MTVAYESKPNLFYKLVSMRMRRDSGFSTAHLRWIDFSVGHGLYHIFENDLKAPAGYLIWAYVNDETVVRLCNRGQLPTYGYEWSEGVITLVLDLLYLSPGNRLPRSMLRQAFARDVDRIAYLRKGGVRLYRPLAGQMTRTALEQFVT